MRMGLGLALCGLVAFVGCGTGGNADRLPVARACGKLTLDGNPLPNALILFHPTKADQKVKSQATTAADGSFAATTYETGDGAPPGEYTLTVVEAKEANAPDDPDPASRPKKSPIPVKFGKPATSKLKVIVDSAKPDLGTIDLK